MYYQFLYMRRKHAYLLKNSSKEDKDDPISAQKEVNAKHYTNRLKKNFVDIWMR